MTQGFPQYFQISINCDQKYTDQKYTNYHSGMQSALK